jgi:HK97 family phage portal protein
MLGNLFEQRAVTPNQLFGAGLDFEVQNNSGTFINEENVYKLTGISAAVSLIAGTISTLPLDAYVRREGQKSLMRPKPDWVNRPDISFVDRTPFISSIIASLMIDGNCFIRIFRDSEGFPINLSVLNPTKIEVKRNGVGKVMFIYSEDNKTYTSNDILHIVESVMRPGSIRGVSRVEEMKDALGLGLALDAYAQRFFGQGTSGTFALKTQQTLTEEQAKSLAKSVDARHGGWRKSHKTIVLHSGLEIEDIGVDPEQTQLLDSRRMFIEDICRIYNIPSHMMNLPGTNTFSSVESSQIQFVTHTLRPYVAIIENALSTLLQIYPNGQGAFIEVNMNSLLRGDAPSRFSAYSQGIQAGVLTSNDARVAEGLSRIDGGDILRVPLANVNIDAADLVATDKRVTMAQKLVLAGFDPAESLAVMGLPAIAHTGVPSVQLQGVAQIDPLDPKSVYETGR